MLYVIPFKLNLPLNLEICTGEGICNKKIRTPYHTYEGSIIDFYFLLKPRTRFKDFFTRACYLKILYIYIKKLDIIYVALLYIYTKKKYIYF